VVAQGADAQRGVRDGTPLKTILEYAEQHGLSTGVVTNSAASDATPAACYAHANDRNKWGEIFAQILSPRFGDGIDVVIGAGRDRILKETAALGVDLGPRLEGKGYRFLDHPPGLAGAGDGTSKLVALFESETRDIDLAGAARTALAVLSRNPNGFFLMVESNNHFTDIRASLELMVRFDEIIRSAASEFPADDTLILFTADHSYDIRLPGGAQRGDDIVPTMRVEGDHTAEEVLVLARGPGAEDVRGFFPNTRLFEIMMAAYGWTPDAARTSGAE
jgi:alkaline phosphatase